MLFHYLNAKAEAAAGHGGAELVLESPWPIPLMRRLLCDTASRYFDCFRPGSSSTARRPEPIYFAYGAACLRGMFEIADEAERFNAQLGGRLGSKAIAAIVPQVVFEEAQRPEWLAVDPRLYDDNPLFESQARRALDLIEGCMVNAYTALLQEERHRKQ